MATLKFYLFLFFSIALFQPAQSQDYNKLVAAFQESYLQEAAGQLSNSILPLKAIYSENSYEINLRLGWLTYQMGLFTESSAYYHKAVALKPYAVEAKFGLAYPASASGNWNEVIQQYEEILKICPNNTTAMHRLGLIYYGRQEYEKAYPLFQKVVNLYPFDYDGLLMFGWTNLKLHKTREAKVLFEKALMHTPGGSSALEGLQNLK